MATLDFAAAPLMFSQVYEDPAVELAGLALAPAKPKVLCVSSGGDTGFALAAQADIAGLTFVDIAGLQNHFCRLHLAAVKWAPSAATAAKVLSNAGPAATEEEKRVGGEMLAAIAKDTSLPEAAKGIASRYADAIAVKGLRGIGAGTATFLAMVDLFREQHPELDVANLPDPASALATRGAREKFEKVWGDEFGRGSPVPEPIRRAFGECIARSVDTKLAAGRTLDDDYWLRALLAAPVPITCGPAYYSSLDKIRSGELPPIDYSDVGLTECAKLAAERGEKYGLVNASNVPDYMPPAAVADMLSALFAATDTGGVLVVREAGFMPAVGMRKMVEAAGFRVHEGETSRWTQAEGTGLYRDVVIAVKP
ncbi:hypothetical protein DFJ74DRAFT_646937 [Hyaloraphidium curvatum]|nr:hypothetical protein DFJ74DRAFT_646937 [Hyaloraphidium curvatum]